MRILRYALVLLPLVCVLALSLPAQEQPPQETEVDLGGGVKMKLRLVKAGKFTQGSPNGEPGRDDDETQRTVNISKDYYIGKYPVKVGEFKRFVDDAKYKTEAEVGDSGGFGLVDGELKQRKEFTWKNPGFTQTDDHPVVMVTHKDAVEFAKWLTKKVNKNCDLPTEAQYEYACRAGTTTAWYNGSNDPKKADDIAWYKDNAGKGTFPVGRKEPNKWGLYDLSGHVFEWTRDGYTVWEAKEVTDPVGDPQAKDPKDNKVRTVLRGGSFLKDVKNTRSAARERMTPGTRNADNGFRVVMAAEGRQPPPPTTGKQPPPATTRPQVPATTGGEKQPPATKGEPVPKGTEGTTRPPDTAPFPGPTGEGGWGTLCCCCGVPALLLGLPLLFLIWFLFLRGRGGAPPREQPPPPRRVDGGPPPVPPDEAGPVSMEGVRTRIGTDGFWIEAPRARPGSIIRYRYVAGGAIRTGQITYTGAREGQFVYTGGTPSDVEVLGVLPPDADPGTYSVTDSGPIGGGTIPTAGRRRTTPPRPTTPPQRTFGGSHPPAY